MLSPLYFCSVLYLLCAAHQVIQLQCTAEEIQRGSHGDIHAVFRKLPDQLKIPERMNTA